MLRAHMPLESEAIAPDGGDLGQDLVAHHIKVHLLALVDMLVHVDDRGIHPRNHVLGQRRDQRADIVGAMAGIDLGQRIARGLQRIAAQGDQPFAIGPQLHRDHVFGLGTGIEVDPAQRRNQRIAFTKGARTGRIAGQQFGGRFGHADNLLQPFIDPAAIAAQVDPQHLSRRARRPVLHALPVDHPATALPVKHAGEQQRRTRLGLRAAGIDIVERFKLVGHKRLMPQAGALVMPVCASPSNRSAGGRRGWRVRSHRTASIPRSSSGQ